jgi:hypothetical protein
MTLAINIGKYGGFYASKSGQAVRLCLGWIAFTIYFFDLDELIVPLMDRDALAEQEQG